MDDKAIISKIKDNDNEALKVLYSNMHDSVTTYLISKGATKEDAMDTFQEALLMFYRNVQNNKFTAEHSKISSYIFAIARNIWLHQLRRQNSSLMKTSSDLIESSYEASLVENENLDEMRAKLESALSKLSDKCRNLILNYYLQDKTTEEIAKELGLSNVNVARQMKYRCMRKLREIYQQEIEISKQKPEK